MVYGVDVRGSDVCALGRPRTRPGGAGMMRPGGVGMRRWGNFGRRRRSSPRDATPSPLPGGHDPLVLIVTRGACEWTHQGGACRVSPAHPSRPAGVWERRRPLSPSRLAAPGEGIAVSGFGFQVSGSGFRVSGFGVRGSGFGFRISGGFGL